ncbi:AI-2E family transporter [Filifactor alocis]|uniref:AI-2E family transporter n=1 Tax=Filifactor alocis TaxID=143361 RepID=UPI0028CFFB0D|nr:AI-2E family transporter [Filifactor alocis]
MIENLKGKDFKKELVLKGILISFAILFYFFIKNIPFALEKIRLFLNTMNPFIYGMVIAYLMFRPVCFIERQLFRLFKRNEKYRQLCRNLSIFFVFLMTFGFLIFIGNVFIPQLVESLTVLTEKIPEYIKQFETFWKNVVQNQKILHQLKSFGFTNISQYKVDFWENLNQKTIKFFQFLIPSVISISGSFTGKIVNILMGIIVSIYLLSGKEVFEAQSKKVLYGIFPNKVVNNILQIIALTNETFQNYIGGQITDAVVLGIITFICMLILRLPMAFMISFLVMVCNVIPMIGSILSGIIGIFLILVISPSQAIVFAILILVLQQVDGNILLPRIVGDSTGLSGFWVFLAIFLGGVIGGLPAMVVSVPVMAVVYTLVKEQVEQRSRSKQMPVGTEEYFIKGE